MNMVRGNDFVFEAASQLRVLTRYPVNLHNRRKDYDATLSINGEAFNVIAKAAIRDSNVGMVVAPFVKQIDKQKSSVLFITKYISKNSATLLRNNDLNYLDAAGNAWIKKEGLFISIEGRKVKDNKNLSRAFQEAGLKLILLLLSKPESVAYSYRELCKQTGISIGSVNNIFNELEDLKFILRTSQKMVIKNKIELIERWVIAYNEVLKPRILRKRMKFLQNLDFTDIKKLARKSSIVWGGEPAAAILTNNFRPQQYILYTNIELAALSKIFRLTPNANGNIEVFDFFWKFQDDAITAPPLVVYADLISSGIERNIEMAKIIFENELQVK